MSITYDYDEARNIVRARGEGVVSTADIRQYVLGIIHNKSIRSGYIEVFSMEDVDDLLVSYREILPFQDLWRDYLKKGCRATLIYAPSELSFGIMRMFQAAIGAEEQDPNVPFMVVRTEAELENALASLEQTSP